MGFIITEAPTGEAGLDAIVLQSPDLVILDIMLPDGSGLDVCKRLREWSDIPVIVLSVKSSEQDKISILDAGADDYLTKPFGMGELIARIRAALRRYRREKTEQSVFRFNGLMVDLSKRQVSLDGADVHLTPLEYELLHLFINNPDRVLTHSFLLDRVWGGQEDLQTLRVHVANLRKKVGPIGGRPTLILTEPGVGYRFKG
jgi:two-component system KDP operon response regulator KdpE